MRLFYLFVIFVFIPLLIQGQTVEEIFNQSNKINRTGMLVLGGWALSNIAYGGYGSLKFSEEKKYFSQMNMMWNLVNAGIAGYALYQFGNTDFSVLSPNQMVSKHNQTQNLYLINAGLDVIYMAGGAYLIRASKNSTNHHHRLLGYGQSVVVQGGFLFVFDLAMYFIQRNHGFEAAKHAVSISPAGVTLSLSF